MLFSLASVSCDLVVSDRCQMMCIYPETEDLQCSIVTVRKYCTVLFMAGSNFMSYGSQTIYLLMLNNKFTFDTNAVTIIRAVAYLDTMT